MPYNPKFVQSQSFKRALLILVVCPASLGRRLPVFSITVLNSEYKGMIFSRRSVLLLSILCNVTDWSFITFCNSGFILSCKLHS